MYIVLPAIHLHIDYNNNLYSIITHGKWYYVGGDAAKKILKNPQRALANNPAYFTKRNITSVNSTPSVVTHNINT